MSIVAAYSDAFLLVPEHQRKNPRRSIGWMHGSFGHTPALSAITRTKHPRNLSSPGREPDILLALNRQAGVAGGKGAFAGQRRGQRRRRDLLPAGAPVVSAEQGKVSVDGIAEYDPVAAVPEGYRVEENARALVFKDLLPALAAVGRPIDLRLSLLGGTGTHDQRVLFVKRVYAAEVEFLCAGHSDHRPAFPAIGGLDDRAARSAGPNHVLIDDAQSAKACGGRDVNFGPLSRRDRGESEQRGQVKSHKNRID